MVLNMGKGDLRGLSPRPAQPAGKPRPFLAHPRKSRPAPCPQLRGRGVRAPLLGPGTAAAPSRPGSGSSGAKAQRRTAVAPGQGARGGALRNLSAAVSSRVHRRLRLDSGGSGAPCVAQGALGRGTIRPTPKTPQGRLSAPRTEKCPPQKPRVGLEAEPGSPLPGPGQEPAQPRQPVRTTTQTFFRPLFSSKLGSHGDRARQLDSPTA